jgi:hypothetical protein
MFIAIQSTSSRTAARPIRDLKGVRAPYPARYPGSSRRSGQDDEYTNHKRPAPRAHLYLAPSTWTGISVE